MTRPIVRPGTVLACGLAVVACTALLPAGLDGRPVPALHWGAWSVVLLAAMGILRAVRGSLARAARGLALLLPMVLLLILPVVIFAAEGPGGTVALALLLRSLAAAAAGIATAALLGPPGVIAGLRSLRVPPPLVEIVHAMLVAIGGIVRQVAAMLRARAARGTGPAPWAALASAPAETLGGFGRLVGALLLRSIERAEALERARRARDGGAP